MFWSINLRSSLRMSTTKTNDCNEQMLYIVHYGVSLSLNLCIIYKISASSSLYCAISTHKIKLWLCLRIHVWVLCILEMLVESYLLYCSFGRVSWTLFAISFGLVSRSLAVQWVNKTHPHILYQLDNPSEEVFNTGTFLACIWNEIITSGSGIPSN